ncbi:MAG TPA: DUF1697 domain-containing protein [Candidatus Acidoferrum sp.]|nr:DUF1697 domain-containing protein [Candidatus Acidoferrum sp.]
MKSLAYVAFLRGINVGGNKLISMEDLKKAFASLGFANIRTVLASGNVVFETADTDPAVLTAGIEQKLQSRFGLEIAVRVRTAEQIQALVASKPFKKTQVTPQTRLHVTFLALNLVQGLKVSQRLKGTDFEIVRVSAGEVCSTVEVSAKRGTTDLMKVLEKQFGKKITTRTWNTVEQIGKLLES